MNHSNIRILVFCALALGLSSCMQSPDDTAEGRFEELDVEHVLLIVLDGSGSFIDEWAGPEGKCYETLNHAIARFHEGRETSSDRIILAQISGRPPSLLWDGTVEKFALQFPDPDTLKKWLLSRMNPNGSPVHQVVTDALTYLSSLHQQAKQMKSACLVFSDFDSNVGDIDQTRAQMAQAFKEYHRVAGDRGAIGCYWVDLAFVPELTKALQDAGFKPNKFIVESGINVSPRLPMFD